MSYVRGDANGPELHKDLGAALEDVAKGRGTLGNVIFYLAIADRLFGPVVERLASAKLTDEVAKGHLCRPTRRRRGALSAAVLSAFDPSRWPIIVAPSILSTDFGDLADEVRAVDKAGADWAHVDVIDGRFVPNITIGPVVVEAIRRSTRKPLNVHLMIVEPERYIADFAKAGVDHLLIQAEPSATVHLHRVLTQIHDLGKKAGVVLDPATPPKFIEYVLHLCDVVLVMTVDPGFRGQAFLSKMLPKVRRVRELCDARGFNPIIEVDGGETPDTAGAAIAVGATAIVAGSAIFGSADYAAAIMAIRHARPPSELRPIA